MPMPRFFRGAPASAASLDTMARAIDNLGLACKVRRTSAMPGQSANTDRVVPFQEAVYDTSSLIDGLDGGMWSAVSPTFIQIKVDGTYLITGQERWPALSTGSPYNTGQRAGKVVLNSTNPYSSDPGTGTLKSDKEGWATDGEGVTLSFVTTERLYAGDRLYLNFWHSAAGPLQCMDTDFGGTFLSVSYQSALT